MAAPRFLCRDAHFELDSDLVVPDNVRHHAGRVLRMVNGQTAVLFDGKGLQASGPIFFDATQARVHIEHIERPDVESPVRITLVQSLVALEKMNWIVEKAVEMGVHAICVTPTLRSSVKLPDAKRLTKRLEHWRDVADAASAQCGRATTTDVAVCSWQQCLQMSADVRCILAPEASKPPRLSAAKSVIVAVGPEGGFDPEEIAAAQSYGWSAARIGPRVLRTETAGIAAAALIHAATGQYAFG